MRSKEDWTDCEEEDETCWASEQNDSNEVNIHIFRDTDGDTIIISGAGRRDETARPWHVSQRWRGGELTWWAVVEVHLEQTELTSECHTVIHCYKYNCNSVWFIPLIILESFHLFKKFSGKAHQNFNFQCLCF